MPSLFRFLLTTGTIAAIVCGGLYILSVKFEPESHEVSKAVPGVKIRNSEILMRSVLAPLTRSAPRLALLFLFATTALAPPAAAQKWFNPFGRLEQKRLLPMTRRSKSPKPTTSCSAPLTRRRSVERTDLDPVMAPDGSGVPYELWRGLTLTAFAEAIERLAFRPARRPSTRFASGSSPRT